MEAVASKQAAERVAKKMARVMGLKSSARLIKMAASGGSGTGMGAGAMTSVAAQIPRPINTAWSACVAGVGVSTQKSCKSICIVADEGRLLWAMGRTLGGRRKASAGKAASAGGITPCGGGMTHVRGSILWVVT